MALHSATRDAMHFRCMLNRKPYRDKGSVKRQRFTCSPNCRSARHTDGRMDCKLTTQPRGNPTKEQ